MENQPTAVPSTAITPTPLPEFNLGAIPKRTIHRGIDIETRNRLWGEADGRGKYWHNSLAMYSLILAIDELVSFESFLDETDAKEDEDFPFREGRPYLRSLWVRYSRTAQIQISFDREGRNIEREDQPDAITRVLTITRWPMFLYGNKPIEVKPTVLYTGRIVADRGLTNVPAEFFEPLFASLNIFA